MSVYLVYNGKRALESCVPGCKITLCHEKAVHECKRCGTPICNGHTSNGIVRGAVCHWCRLDEWTELQGSREASE